MSTNNNNEFTSTRKRNAPIPERSTWESKKPRITETNSKATKQELRLVDCNATRSAEQFELSQLPSLPVSSFNYSYLSMVPSTSTTSAPNYKAVSMDQTDIEKLKVNLINIWNRLITPENIAAVNYYLNHPKEKPSGTLKNLLPYIAKPTVNNLCKCKFCKP